MANDRGNEAKRPFSADGSIPMEKTWGLSFQINTQTAPSGRPAGSLSWAGLANSYYWIDRETGIGGAYLTQILPFADEKSLPLFDAFETQVYQSLS